MKPIIRLYDLTGLGLVICCESGVIISNQTGGYSCLQPEIEGIFVPLLGDDPSALPIERDLNAYFVGRKHRGAGATAGLDLEDADFVDALLARTHLCRAMRVDRSPSRLRGSHEAWIYVSLLADESTYAHFGPHPRPGVLTWSNSD